MRDFAHQIVYSDIFWVQEITYSQDAPTNFDANTLKDAVPGIDVVTEAKSNIYTSFFSKKQPILGPILYSEIFSRKTALTLEALRVNDP